METILLNILFFMLLGVGCYWLDVNFGSVIQKWSPEKKGFIIDSSISKRVSLACLLVIILNVILVTLQIMHIWEAVIYALPEALGLVLGFYTGPTGLRWISKKDKVLNYLDDVESGKVNLGADLKKGATNLGNKVAHMAAQTVSGDNNSTKKSDASQATGAPCCGSSKVAPDNNQPKIDNPPKAPRDPVAAIEKFVKDRS